MQTETEAKERGAIAEYPAGHSCEERYTSSWVDIGDSENRGEGEDSEKDGRGRHIGGGEEVSSDWKAGAGKQDGEAVVQRENR